MSTDSPEQRVYLTGTGQRLVGVHPETASCLLGCPVHAPTPHHMRDWPTHWRGDRGLMERICPHGVGHPDPDHLAHTARRRGPQLARVEASHGCDGCCAPPPSLPEFRYLVSFWEGQPRGLAMWRRTRQRLDMVAWDWLRRAWCHAPDLVMPLLVGATSAQAREVTRREAEEIAARLGLPPLPSEAEAEAMGGP